MTKFLLFSLFTCCFSYCQNPKVIHEYLYGNNGIEYIVKSTSGNTVVVSTFNARPTIKRVVAEKIFDYFKEINPKNGDRIKICLNNAIVYGILNVENKAKLTLLGFYYESVEWKTGITELYKNPNETINL